MGTAEKATARFTAARPAVTKPAALGWRRVLKDVAVFGQSDCLLLGPWLKAYCLPSPDHGLPAETQTPLPFQEEAFFIQFILQKSHFLLKKLRDVILSFGRDQPQR